MNISTILARYRKPLVSIGLPVLIAVGFTLYAIYVNSDYGIALFVLIPFLLGLGTVVLYGQDSLTSIWTSVKRGYSSLGIYTTILFLSAMEGLICLLMAAPFALLLCALGSLLGHFLMKKHPGSSEVSVILLMILIPCFSFYEKDMPPPVVAVTTSVEIKADRETVWNNVTSFPELDNPHELLFKAGIAYPTSATIDGRGVGAVRHCNFTTGSFVEPITTWDEPSLLKFSVDQQPSPMKEISFWDVNAPHLHDYFVSKEGQFRLTTLPNGNTLLEGTTWYAHDIKPAFYWRIWSNYIVHAIHKRVPDHIKQNAEANKK
jgi:hypothetical protein